MNNSATKSRELENRLITLSIETIKSIKTDKSLPQSIKVQLIRSITSIGANYLEANNAISKDDFRHKLYICKKETAESIYWIKIIRGLKNDSEFLDWSYCELNEVIKIFQKAVNTIGSKSKW